MKTVRIWLIIAITIGFFTHLKSQYNFHFEDFDSIKIYKYQGLINKKTPLLPPPPSEAKRKIKKEYKKYLKKRRNEFKVDTTWQIAYQTDLSVDREGKYNHSIEWNSGVKLDSIQMEELDSILLGEKMNPLYNSVVAMCYYPRHTVFLYRNGKVVYNFDICIECHRTKLNGEYLETKIDYGYLAYLFKKLGFEIDSKWYD